MSPSVVVCLLLSARSRRVAPICRRRCARVRNNTHNTRTHTHTLTRIQLAQHVCVHTETRNAERDARRDCGGVCVCIHFLDTVGSRAVCIEEEVQPAATVTCVNVCEFESRRRCGAAATVLFIWCVRCASRFRFLWWRSRASAAAALSALSACACACMFCIFQTDSSLCVPYVHAWLLLVVVVAHAWFYCSSSVVELPTARPVQK